MPKLSRRPVVIIVRDGWGHNPHPEWNHANAVYLAKKPVNDRLLVEYPWVQIHTSGEDVGLPAGVMGNSEVGHQNIGAGRIVDQEIMRITRRVRDGSFFTNPTLAGAFEHARKTGGSVHLIGLFSNGRVHSDMDHAFAIVGMAERLGFPGDRFFVHAITDGRDTPPKSGLGFIQQLEKKLQETRVGRVASLVGRYYAMDRDNRWDRVQCAYNMLTKGSPQRAESATAAVTSYYDHPSEPSRSGDEFITATSIVAAAPPGGLEGRGAQKVHGQDAQATAIDSAQLIKSGDAVIFFNYRGDRPREITKAFVLSDEDWKKVPNGGFDRGPRLENLYYATMTGYESGLPVRVIFNKPEPMVDILGAYISGLGLRQFRCAETEKFPHVTFFFNDYREPPFDGEDRQILPSPKDVTTYDKKPQMSAYEVTDEMLRRIASHQYDLIVLNYANGDMVGHTGVLTAAIKAVETVDECVGKVVDAVLAQGGSLIVTADHGNCEQMIDPATGGPHTAHTTYDVDLIVVDDRLKNSGVKLKEDGRLADIAPTALALMGLAQPKEMTGQSLVSGASLK